jgi:hypothetical protein
MGSINADLYAAGGGIVRATRAYVNSDPPVGFTILGYRTIVRMSIARHGRMERSAAKTVLV